MECPDRANWKLAGGPCPRSPKSEITSNRNTKTPFRLVSFLLFNNNKFPFVSFVLLKLRKVAFLSLPSLHIPDTESIYSAGSTLHSWKTKLFKPVLNENNKKPWRYLYLHISNLPSLYFTSCRDKTFTTSSSFPVRVRHTGPFFSPRGHIFLENSFWSLETHVFLSFLFSLPHRWSRPNLKER